MWSGVGLALCVTVIAIALVKGKRTSGSFYARDVYGMTARTHARYAIVSALFAALFIAGLAHAIVLPVVPLLALYVLIFVFYVSSFARGFSDEE
jgi:hypothetical protein